jgi:hypothetical protein
MKLLAVAILTFGFAVRYHGSRDHEDSSER